MISHRKCPANLDVVSLVENAGLPEESSAETPVNIQEIRHRVRILC